MSRGGTPPRPRLIPPFGARGAAGPPDSGAPDLRHSGPQASGTPGRRASGLRGARPPGLWAPGLRDSEALDLRDSGALTSRALTSGPPVAPQFSPLNDGTARRPQGRGG